MEKEFKTINEQIELLKSRKLQIQNKESANEILENNNYYYLINGYKELFLDKRGKKEIFLKKTTLEEIYNLYEFDRKIRILFLEYILLIERRIDTYIAYEFSKNYGHKNYLVPENFNNINKNKDLITKFIKDINLEISHQYKNTNKMIVHYLDTYKYIPLWVLIRILSFGKVSKFYSFMKQKEQNNISRKFNIRSEALKVYLINLGNVRNICAHDEKLYDVILKYRINVTEYHRQLRLEKEVVQIMGENKNIRKAIEELEQVSGDEKLQRIAELREKAIRDEHAALSLATKRGMEQGLQQGIERGIEQGIQQGLEKGIEQNKIETAKNMLKENMNIELIEKITGLKQDEIEKIKKNL